MGWNKLNMAQKARLIGLYVQNGVTSLDEMKQHYNSLGDGGPIKKKPFSEWYKTVNPQYNDTVSYDLQRAYNELPYEQLEAWRLDPNHNHLPDTYKHPTHTTFSNESIYSRGPIMGGTWHWEPIKQGQYRPNEVLVGGINGREPNPIYNEYAVGGFTGDPPVYQSRQGTLPVVNITANKPEWQSSLTDYDWKRYRAGEIDLATLKSIASKRKAGSSTFMNNVNRLSPTNMVREGLASSRKFIQDTPGLEFLYDATATGLTFSPLFPIGLTMQTLDAAAGLNDMIENGPNYNNVTDVLGVVPVKIKGTRNLGKVLNPHTGKVTTSTMQIPKQLYWDLPVGVNELLINDLMMNTIDETKEK